MSSKRQPSMATTRYVMSTTYSGHLLLTNLLLPRLIKSGPGSRIINVASLRHTLVKEVDIGDLNFARRPFSMLSIGPYMHSKVAVVMWTRQLAKRLEGNDLQTSPKPEDMDPHFNYSSPNLIVHRLPNSTHCGFTTSYDPMLILISCVILIVALIGFFGNCLLFTVLHDAHLLHKNVRFLFANMTMSTTIICLCFVARCIFNLAAMINGLSWRSVSARACSFFELPATASAFVLSLSICAFGAERLYATWIRQTTEYLSKWLVFMVVGIWAIVILNAAMVILTTEQDRSMCYCHTLLCYRWPVIATTMTFYFTTEITALCLYLAVYRWNRIRLTSFGINSATHSLAERFQIANTIRATETLLPNVVLHGICWSLLQLASYYPRTLYVTDGPTYKVVYLALGVTGFALIHCAVHPYLTIYKSDNLQRALRRLFARALRRFDAGGNTHLQSSASNGSSRESRRFILASSSDRAPSMDARTGSLQPPTIDRPSTSQGIRMSILSATGTSEGATSVRGEASSCGRMSDVGTGGGQMVQQLDSSQQRGGRRLRKKKPPTEGVRAFQMTPEQHCELLEKYWE